MSYIVGIAGGSASGKSYFVESLKEAFPSDQLTVVSQDNYYRPIGEQRLDKKGIVNFDLPEAIDEELLYQDLVRLKRGEHLQRKEYTFNNPGSTARSFTLKPCSVILVEGLFILHFKKLAQLLNFSIFIDADEQVKWQRRLRRDTSERGLDKGMVEHQWHNHVIPAFQQYLLPYKEHVHLVVSNNSGFGDGFEKVKGHIEQRLTRQEPNSNATSIP